MHPAKASVGNPEATLSYVPTNIADGHPIGRINELMPWSAQNPGFRQ